MIDSLMSLRRLALYVAAFFFALGPGVCAQTNSSQGAAQPQSGSTTGQQAPPQDEDQTNKPSLLTPLAPKTEAEPYHPITPRQRLRWIITDTIGPEHLAGGVITSAFGTALDRPREYGSSWPGFAQRFGMRLTGVATSNVMEAGLGAVWGEDPRYFSVPGESFGERMRSIVKQTFYARQRDGNYQIAYARLMAISGSNFLSNTWRADSEADSEHAMIRTLEGFAGRMSANAFDEFWPSARDRLFHRKH